MGRYIIFLQGVTVDKTDNYLIHYLKSICQMFYLLFYLVTIESKCSNTESGLPKRTNFLYIFVGNLT